MQYINYTFRIITISITYFSFPNSFIVQSFGGRHDDDELTNIEPSV